MSTTHNSYFDGQVQSLGFERLGLKATTGVIQPGEYHFNTDAPERMTIVSGSCTVQLDGSDSATPYTMGTSFEIAGKSGFTISVNGPCVYLCEFL